MATIRFQDDFAQWSAACTQNTLASTLLHSQHPTDTACSKRKSCADLIQNGGHKNISKEPLVINGMGGGVLGVGKPQGSSHRGALLVALVKGCVEVGQQLVPHLDGTPTCICHRLPQIQLLQTNRLLLKAHTWLPQLGMFVACLRAYVIESFKYSCRLVFEVQFLCTS